MAQLNISSEQLAALLEGLAAGRSAEEVVADHVKAQEVAPVHERLHADLADHRVNPLLLLEAFRSIHERLDHIEHPEDDVEADPAGDVEDQADVDPAPVETTKPAKSAGRKAA